MSHGRVQLRHPRIVQPVTGPDAAADRHLTGALAPWPGVRVLRISGSTVDISDRQRAGVPVAHPGSSAVPGDARSRLQRGRMRLRSASRRKIGVRIGPAFIDEHDLWARVETTRSRRPLATAWVHGSRVDVPGASRTPGTERWKIPVRCAGPLGVRSAQCSSMNAPPAPRMHDIGHIWGARHSLGDERAVTVRVLPLAARRTFPRADRCPSHARYRRHGSS